MRKKFAAVLLSACIAGTLCAGCGQTADAPAAESAAGETAQETEETGETETAEKESAGESQEIAMVIDHEGSIDDKSFNQGTWEGIKAYADANGKGFQYYQSMEDSDEEYLNCFELAINGGAEIIICPSYMFEAAIYKAQDLYPDVNFMIIDGRPQAGDDATYATADNTYSVIYAEEQAGFLAGYAAVKDGYRKLGFMGGMAVPAVVRFGYGFVQGADYAAKELGLGEGEIEISYAYTGNFDATPDNQNKAASWYQAGTEVIFACGGAVGQSVFAAAEANNGKAIGVDVDQSGDSETVITSSIKQLQITVNAALEAYYAGSFPGGVDATLGVESDGVGLVMDNARFETFTQEDYDGIYAAMKENKDGILDSILKDTDVESADELPVVSVTVKVME